MLSIFGLHIHAIESQTIKEILPWSNSNCLVAENQSTAEYGHLL